MKNKGMNPNKPLKNQLQQSIQNDVFFERMNICSLKLGFSTSSLFSDPLASKFSFFFSSFSLSRNENTKQVRISTEKQLNASRTPFGFVRKYLYSPPAKRAPIPLPHCEIAIAKDLLKKRGMILKIC